MQLRRDDPVGVPRWPIWSLPRSVLSIIALVEVLAIGLVVAGVVRGYGPVGDTWLITLAVLIGAGILSTEASLGVERIRRQSDETPHIDLSSVWTFAAAVLLPGMLATVVVIVIYAYMYFGCGDWRRCRCTVLFSTATVVLAVRASAAVIGYAPASIRSTASPGW